MQEIWSDVKRWHQAGTPAALATVIDVKGSSLRPQGSKMAISVMGDISGSVTGGCVEGAVFDEAQAVLKSGIPRLLSYGVSNEAAWEIGLSCGGSIQVFVESMSKGPWEEIYPAIQECLEFQQVAALATVVAGPGLGNKLLLWLDGRQTGNLGSPALNAQAVISAEQCWATHSPVLASYTDKQSEGKLFIDVFTPQPRLVIIGAVHIAIPLVTIAKTMNFRTIVIDARSAFATHQRFPHVDELIVEWPSTALEKLRPDAETYVVCLSHDEKLDNPALQVALTSPARYVGVLGSRKTHANRLETLGEMGVAEETLARIHAPIGLDLGARYPEEIALAIMAEIIAVRHGDLVKQRGRQI